MEWIGWCSSCLIVITLGKQVLEQWQRGSSKGVSKWLFVGQGVASLGFLVYAASLKNWVFLVTNVLMVGNAIVGLAIYYYHQRRHRA